MSAATGPPAAAEPLLEVRDLHTYFRTGRGLVRAVNGVSFTVPAGGSVGIVGESGSGKSVASLSVMGLVAQPGYIAAGSITFKGRELTKLPDKAMRDIRGRDIGFVFQDPMTALNPVYRVGAQVAEALRAHQKVDKRAALERATAMFRHVGIPAPEQRVHDYPNNLSGGMRQRVVIAMAMINEPDLLILDEPTTALDATVQAQILDLIADVRARVNTSVLLITHDIGVVKQVCSEIIVMYGGKVMERGPTARIVAEPRHPYTIGLLGSLPSPEMRGQRLKMIPGSVPSPLNMPPGCPFASRCDKVMDACAEMPELKTLDDGRQLACWLR
ncbi:MAG TPA: ABC transporter ATP-binding protein [Trebonia sp.]|nr:ABC transporter ATP-binding protein [Trebonia sp.]